MKAPAPAALWAPTAPLIVGIGGTPNPSSSSEAALRLALAVAERAGCRTRLFGGGDLCALPHYGTGERECQISGALVSSIREAKGLIISTPAYHGSFSGLIKNALDYIEDTARDARVYRDGMPVGLIVSAYGAQAIGSTLGSLRSVVHALRGWPTPYGLGINTQIASINGEDGADMTSAAQIQLLASQVVDFVSLDRPSIVRRSAA